MHSPNTRASRPFAARLLVILAVFVALTSIYAVMLQRNMDEFGMANVIVRLTAKVPYRDFAPPKTLLANYLTLPMFVLVADPWQALTAARLLIVILTALVLGGAALYMRRWLSDSAILSALLLLILMSNFAERQMELRADGPSALLALAALLALMGGRGFAAGVFTGLSFLTTQKGIYFVFAGEVATVGALIADRSRARLAGWLRFNAGAAVTLFTYVAFWAAVTSPQAVLHSTFANSNISVALNTVYSVRLQYWTQAVVRNPLFFAIAAFGVIVLGIRWLRGQCSPAEVILLPFSMALTACAIWHKQPWPYFFVNIVPTLFVVNAFALEWIGTRLRASRVRSVAITAFVLLGVLLPLSRLRSTLRQTSAFQEAMFRAGNELVSPREKYLDGVGMLYRRGEAVELLDWMDKARLEYLHGLPRAELVNIVAEIDSAPTKLLLWNYRMASLPPLLREALLARFARIYGDLFYYAPSLRPGRFGVAFTGTYRIVTEAPAVAIDGATVANGAILDLPAGGHDLRGAPVRLQLLPPPGLSVDEAYSDPRDPFGGIYSY